MARDYDRPDREDAGAGRRGSDRRSSDRPGTDRGEKKIFNRRDKPERGEGRDGGERRSYNADRREGGERRPYGDRREGSERRSYGSDRREDADRRPVGDRREGGRTFSNDRRESGERRSYGGDRNEGRERRSYDNDRRENGERRSFTPRREEGERGSYNSDRRDSGERRSYGREDNERRSYGNDRRESSDRKPYGDRREGGERRNYGSDRREGGDRRDFNADRPERSNRNYERPGKQHSEERQDYRNRREDAEKRLKGIERSEQRGYASPEKREERGAKRSDKPSFGDRRDAGYERKPFKSDKDSKFGAGDRRGRFDKSEGEQPKTPTYNIDHYKDNPRIKKTNREDGVKDDTIRLNRYIANAGVCSRREADTLIESGEIKVNGQVVTEMGYKVKPSDTVQYGKTLLNREKLVYVLLNKPKDFITTTEDPEGRKTVMSLIEKASSERIFPVGRLDRNTTGLLLFTNDGELAQKLTHPSNEIRKIYQVELDKPITKEDFLKIAEGVELEDGKANVDDVAMIGDTGRFLGLEIHIGRNRIVRRIFEHLGYDVVTLDRVQYAGLTKKDIPRGNWRYLTEKEVIRLKYFM